FHFFPSYIHHLDIHSFPTRRSSDLQPEIDIEQIERGKALIFTANVEVKPEVTLGEYKGLEVEEQDVTVTDEDVDHELEHQREHHAELVVKEDGEVEEEDTDRKSTRLT